MLSIVSRILTYACAALYTAVGGLLFVHSVDAAPVFAWKVTPFMTITIGGWCLGNAWLAFLAARRWDWGRVHTSLLYLWLFGLLEAAVVLAFRERLALGHWIAWLYLATIGLNVLTALVGVADFLRLRPAVAAATPTPRLQRALAGVFVVVVGFLGYYGLTAQMGDLGTNGGIFPEVMSPFTLRAFGAFYLSLSLAAIPLVWGRSQATLLHHGAASYGLIVMITAAAFAYLHLFDLAQKPFTSVYIGFYLMVGVATAVVLKRHGTGTAS